MARVQHSRAERLSRREAITLLAGAGLGIFSGLSGEAESGMPIVTSGGYYRQLTYPPRIARVSESSLLKSSFAMQALSAGGPSERSAPRTRSRLTNVKCSEPSARRICGRVYRFSATPPTANAPWSSSIFSNRSGSNLSMS